MTTPRNADGTPARPPGMTPLQMYGGMEANRRSAEQRRRLEAEGYTFESSGPGVGCRIVMVVFAAWLGVLLLLILGSVLGHLWESLSG